MNEELEKRLRALSPEQRQRLLEQMAARRKAGTESKPVASHPDDFTYGSEAPLSRAQAQMWLTYRFGDGGYLIPFVLHLKGAVDVVAMGKAVEAIIERHEVLRTTFPVSDGEPVQRILSAASEGQWGFQDFRSEDDAEAAILRTNVAQTFDLEREPPFRVRLFRVEADEWVLVLSFHHICIDEWGIGLLVEELESAYLAIIEEGEFRPDGPAPQAAQYALWEREQLKGDDYERGLETWRAHLAGAPPRIEWPWGESSPAGDARDTRRVDLALPGRFSAELRELSRRHGLTAIEVYLAATALFVREVTNQTDMVIGVPVTLRDRPEWSNVLGMMVNTLPVRLTITSDEVGEVFSAVKAAWRNALRLRWIPFDDVVRVTGTKREGTSVPMFDTLLNFVPSMDDLESFGDLEVHSVPVPLRRTRFTLIITAQSSEENPRVTFNFDSDRFDSSTAATLVRCFQRILTALPHSSEGSVAHLQGLDASDRAELAASQATVTAVAIREALLASLPAELVPRIVFVDEIPRLPGGKADRAALAARGYEPQVDRTAPRTETEAVLAAIWAKHLGTESVGVRSSFFELGGHSLLAVRVQHDLERALGVELPLSRFLQSPTIEALAAWCDQETTVPRGASIGRHDYGDRAPVSADQQRMWFLQELEPQSCAYLVPVTLRLTGELDVEALRGAVSDLVARHEILRTTFPEEESGPVQSIRPAEAPLVWQTRSFAASDEPEREAAAWLRQECATSFSLQTETPLRTSLLRLSDEHHVLALIFHHIAVDEWSMGIALSELKHLYQARRDGRAPDLEEPRLQYADYAIWQRERRESDEFVASLDFWRTTLTDAPDHLDWPIGAQTVEKQGAPGEVKVTLERAAAGALRDLARDSDTTLFVALWACVSAYLARVTGTNDLTVGIPVSMRERTEFRGLMGLVLNTVPLRARVSWSQTFSAWLSAARETWNESTQHHWVPLDDIVKAVGAERRGGQPPLFDVMFTYVPGAPTQENFGDAKAAPAEQPILPDAKVPLSIAVSDLEGGALQVLLEYDEARFAASEVRRLAEQFTCFVENLLARPSTPMGNQSYLPGATIDRLRKWARGEKVEVPHGVFPELFAHRAAQHPDVPALHFGDLTWSYSELDAWANEIANELVVQGVTPAEYVGISCDRSPELVAGILGIMRAGCAYVPLEPALPSERLRFMMENAGIRAVVCDSSGVERLSGLSSAVPLTIDATHRGLSSPAPEIDIAPSQLAYLLYTSGTTGRPKGVMMTHRGLTNFAAVYARSIYSFEGDASDRRVALKSSPTFDMFVAELFPALLSGSSVVVIPEGMERLPRKMSQELSLRGVTDLQSTPTMLAMLVEGGERRELRTLHHVYSGGEALAPSLVRAVHQQWGVRLWNLYGPTEMCVGQAQYLTHEDDETIPIGVASLNQEVWLVDETHAAVDEGFRGNLMIAGPGEARGYLEMPRRTALSFVPHPYGPRGGRAYRSGDLGVWNENGQIEYRGRDDDQLQVQGVRVELAEIEARLESVESVGRAAVLPVNVSRGRADALVAFVQPRDPDAPPIPDELRAELRAYLSDDVVPRRIEVVEEMPLMPSGKIDRAALPTLVRHHRSLDSERPETERERQIAAVWCRHLQIPAVGLHDNFFDLGGHSLLAVRVHRELTEVFGMDLPLSQFVANPTVAGFARWLDEHDENGGDMAVEGLARGGLVASLRGGDQGTLILVHPVGGTLLGYRDLVPKVPEGIEVLGIAAPPPSYDEVPREMESLADFYVDKLLAARSLDNCQLAGWSFGGVLAFAMVERLRERGIEVSSLCLIDSYAPDLARESIDPTSPFLPRFLLDLLGTMDVPWQVLESLLSEDEPPDLEALARLLNERTNGRIEMPPATLSELMEAFGRHESALLGFQPSSVAVETFLVIPVSAPEVPRDRGWTSHLKSPPQVVTVQADHYSILKADAVRHYAHLLGC